ncbi:GIY-YIG nuclease family protein [Methanosphaera sp. ISO3-F5]|uniref:GIY-YIG nuclease family protein n=1 Tax=Methanosphaera sp. ISO3-F5 TaxID=1452353 RepID=UPI002B25F8DA|nr:GIY-YIG nuclease family protein [Methanosphaera sp. ISO3-F5]WQH64605.1 GIY-YIG nuclease family protein [Methanosphaera sp. ISO3-F5]
MIDKGNYCVIIELYDDCNIKVGARGLISFSKGFYVYVGSALNCLSKRIERHISKDKKKHWHVDYLLLNKNVEVKEVIYTYCSEKIECRIANEILSDSVDYIDGFGCSDCDCVSHLYYFNTFQDALESSIQSYEKNNYPAKSWIN